ncbi:DUF5132 domain-containing protein [Desertifilum sp. FACHB-1129]|uniref:DUF5132 domain-containing protein n=2 Tax=Desertifilum tharense IPPAS B-1220 TaxID=1781255 RepID=A0A1E5QFN0_9CYAN|nr:MULTISPECIES: DUF5132 domain-containing protein [Desertifilum]MDA0212700.1 DUF5132 domain-containing protein [Cyanobacteria bacterium FC1]MBD2313069.1 DUF5132 domain-containing protein [Desertifilum sp. FACHB-1129]MBD2324125.1 DUF5132 domain-containing protein [Desertifilum sp. FACHB-866]MBD2334060.1 DUF5132 domain-containing protein [Desertifilum sp. FACHB-868]OEJ73143.1 DUF5132 domain-containing protein [Desertifilum tharense IPPAS B-1220]
MQQMHPGNLSLRARVAELAADPNARTIAVGVATVAIAPLLLPLVKPALKATIKTGVMLMEKTKGAIAETGEAIADIAAEARAEALAEAQQKAAFPAVLPIAKSPSTEG